MILDIMMPGTDGLAVCRELRTVSDIPIILLTAKDSELDYVMGISQGSDDYLTKPFRPTILLMKVKRCCACGDGSWEGQRQTASCAMGTSAIPPRKTPSLRKHDRGADTDRLRLLGYDETARKGYSGGRLLNAVWGFNSEVEDA